MKEAAALLALASVDFRKGLRPHIQTTKGRGASVGGGERRERARVRRERQDILEAHTHHAASLLKVNPGKFTAFADMIFQGGAACGLETVSREALFVMQAPRMWVNVFHNRRTAVEMQQRSVEASYQKLCESVTDMFWTEACGLSRLEGERQMGSYNSSIGSPDNDEEDLESKRKAAQEVTGEMIAGVVPLPPPALDDHLTREQIKGYFETMVKDLPYFVSKNFTAMSAQERAKIVRVSERLFGGGSDDSNVMLRLANTLLSGQRRHDMVLAVQSAGESLKAIKGLQGLQRPPLLQPAETDWLLLYMVSSPDQRRAMIRLGIHLSDHRSTENNNAPSSSPYSSSSSQFHSQHRLGSLLARLKADTGGHSGSSTSSSKCVSWVESEEAMKDCTGVENYTEHALSWIKKASGVSKVVECMARQRNGTLTEFFENMSDLRQLRAANAGSASGGESHCELMDTRLMDLIKVLTAFSFASSPQLGNPTTRTAFVELANCLQMEVHGLGGGANKQPKTHFLEFLYVEHILN